MGRGQVTGPSHGYESTPPWWRSQRTSTIHPGMVLQWARGPPPRTALLDLGCGDGFPMSVAPADAGFDIHGIDASPTMLAGFRQRLPHAPTECRAAEEASFFECTFDGVLSWGLLLLLVPDTQRTVIAKVAQALNPGGRFLFTAPWQTAEWSGAMTGRPSVSLGRDEYTRVLAANGLTVTGDAVDEGENYYYFSRKTG